MSAAGGQQPVSLEELPVPQLNAIKQQLEEELQQLMGAANQLKQAQDRFADAIDSLTVLEANNNNTAADSDAKTTGAADTLIPLTSNLFVPGKVVRLAKEAPVLVDIGTGYFAEKSTEDAKDYFKRKVDFLKTNQTRLNETVMGKQSQLEAVVDMMQAKVRIANQQAAQQQQQTAA